MLPYLAAALTIALNLLSAYFAVIALFAVKKPRPYPFAAPACRFAVLIPARNEEAVVGALVDSLNRRIIPRPLYDVYVAPNNCIDDTAEPPDAAGPRSLPAPAVRCKGDVLRQTIRRCWSAANDAICVFDADNVADRDFLQEMNNAFVAGVKVAKGRILAKNPYCSWVAGSYDIYFRIFFDLFFNRPRPSAVFRQSWWAPVSRCNRSVLEELGGWDTRTVAEDAEFSAQCAAAGYRCPGCRRPSPMTSSPSPSVCPCPSANAGAARRDGGGAHLPSKFAGRPSGRARPLALDFIAFLLMPSARALSVLPFFWARFSAASAGLSCFVRFSSVLWRRVCFYAQPPCWRFLSLRLPGEAP
jgi:cellulose synthase/poly-beta-1,6-N-acetylglucosamine synthase-like glycosyltransferase